MSWIPTEDPVVGDKRACDALEIVIVPRERDLGDGFTVRRALPDGKRRTVGPFVFFDQMGPVRLAAGKDFHKPSGLAVFARLGFRYQGFLIDNVTDMTKNPAKLPSEVMKAEHVDMDAPGPGELVIDVAAAGLGFPDVLMCRGTYPLAPPVPFTGGQEFVGTVAAVGPGVGTAVGTRVMGVAAFMIGRGAFAAQCKTYEPMTFPVPAALPDAEAAAFTIACPIF